MQPLQHSASVQRCPSVWCRPLLATSDIRYVKPQQPAHIKPQQPACAPRACVKKGRLPKCNGHPLCQDYIARHASSAQRHAIMNMIFIPHSYRLPPWLACGSQAAAAVPPACCRTSAVAVSGIKRIGGVEPPGCAPETLGSACPWASSEMQCKRLEVNGW